MAVFHLEDLFDALDLAGEDAIECGAVAWPKLSCILNTGEAEHMGFQQPLSIAILERWAYRGGPPLLYRLPEIIEAVALDQLIMIVEGEKCCEALANLNIVATTCAGGARKWRTEHSEPLRGADVIILPDNDEPGRDHANFVATSLNGIAARIRVLDLPDLAHKGDVVDWISDGGTADTLWNLVETQARIWNPNSSADSIKADIVFRLASEIEPKAIQYLWPGRLARGKHTAIAGEPGTGKSQASMFFAAACTIGGEWPCGEGRAPIGNVIILSAEDDAEATLVPRLIAAGADLTRVHIIDAVRADDSGTRSLNLQADISRLEELIKQIGDVALVIVDPLSSYLGKIDSHKNADVRSVLEPLSKVAERTGAAVLSITHFSKPGANTGAKALHRFIGSIAFVAAARFAFAVIEDAENEGRRLFLHVKNNLAAPPQGLAFRLAQRIVAQPDVVASHIEWDSEPVGLTANEAIAADAARTDRKSAGAEAEEFLREILARGSVAQRDIRSEAEGAGLAWATVRRAKDRLDIKPCKDGMDGGWRWSLPKVPIAPEGAHINGVSIFAIDEHLRSNGSASHANPNADDDLGIPEFLCRS